MKIQKEAELTRAIIVYCQRCQEEGDLPALKEMGFGQQEIAVLPTLTTADVLRLASTKSHFLSINVNTTVYWRMIDYIKRESEKDNLIDIMMINEAPLPMMHTLFGMNSKEFTMKRRTFGYGKASPGRPPTPSAEVSQKVWEAIQVTTTANEMPTSQEFIDIFNLLDGEVSLREIWHLVNKWNKDDKLGKT